MEHQQSKRVLIIDDSVDMHGLLKIFLESKNYIADFSTNGSEALELLSSGAELPNVILLDLWMPVMNGQDFLDARAAIPEINCIPVIVMSGAEDADLSSVAGFASDYLCKPISLNSVLLALERNFILH